MKSTTTTRFEDFTVQLDEAGARQVGARAGVLEEYRVFSAAAGR